MPKTISLVRFGKTQHKTHQSICTGLDTPQGLVNKLPYSFREMITAVEQSANEPSARVAPMAGASTVVAFTY